MNIDENNVCRHFEGMHNIEIEDAINYAKYLQYESYDCNYEPCVDWGEQVSNMIKNKFNIDEKNIKAILEGYPVPYIGKKRKCICGKATKSTVGYSYRLSTIVLGNICEKSLKMYVNSKNY